MVQKSESSIGPHSVDSAVVNSTIQSPFHDDGGAAGMELPLVVWLAGGGNIVLHDQDGGRGTRASSCTQMSRDSTGGWAGISQLLT